MSINWDQVRVGAAEFSRKWEDASSEKREMQSFYDEFFRVFGIERRKVASYEYIVTKSDNSSGYIDVFWPGVLLVEHKSAGDDLDRAEQQAREYIDAVDDSEKPRYQMVSDFETIRLLDRKSGDHWSFTLDKFSKNIRLFGFMWSEEPRDFGEQDEVNIKASELIGQIHDGLKESGYPSECLENLLVRIVFCLFADDTEIFQPRDLFHNFLLDRTREDASDTGDKLNRIFEILNTQEDRRQRNLDEKLAQFPYVDGGLFNGTLATADFDTKLRLKLLEACDFDWSEISPAIFGSLFQSVMDSDKRRAIGAHYTTEQNILKVIEPLFLDELRSEFKRICGLKRNRAFRLRKFQEKLRQLTFFDPACGCGNFLIIAYRELRQLEIEVLRQLVSTGQLDLDAQNLSIVDVDQFYGIELEEFPARIAETALWMMDHIMNNRLGEAFGTVYTRIPLHSSAHIVCEDALEIDWQDVLASSQCSFILGNPPFAGSKKQSPEQRDQVHRIARFEHIKGTLDYVTCWFLQAAAYIEGDSRIGFVATNSITQGEQVGQLWPLLFDRFGLEISFAHSTFSWTSEARGAAHVHVVIIGLVLQAYDNKPNRKRLFSYENFVGQPQVSHHSRISPYLVPELEKFPYVTVQSCNRPINGFLALKAGSKPIDNGIYIFTSEQEKDEFLKYEPDAAKFIRPYVGAQDLIHGTKRYILALQEATPDELDGLPQVRKRIKAVREFRLQSTSPPTLKLAESPRQYHINVLPKSPYLVIPVTSSERRKYIPIAWLEPPTIPNVDTRVLLDATLADFALLTSRMHMVWLRFVGGRLKSDYRYSIGLVYNAFPRPDGDLDKLNTLAQDVLDKRAEFTETPYMRLYDPDFMPETLRAVHRKLDLAIERLYRKTPFQSDRDRIEFLFSRYQTLVQPLLIRNRGYERL